MFKLQAFTTALNFQARLSQANLQFVYKLFSLDNIIVIAVSSRRPDRAEDEPSDEDDSLEETNVFCTETGIRLGSDGAHRVVSHSLMMVYVSPDVTLPSDLVRSWSCSVLNSRGKGVVDQSSGAAAAVHVYQEMLHIHEKLQVKYSSLCQSGLL